MKTVLIIGGNGFIGTRLIRYLSQHGGYKIISFDLKKPVNFRDDITYIEGNFFLDNDLEKALVGVDIVIHALSTIYPGNSNIEFLRGYANDLVQTANLCSMLSRKKIDMIFLSSGGTVYGEQKFFPIKENALPHPINHYGCLKLCIENIIRTFNAQYKMHMRIARIANPYGPGQDFSKGVGFIDAVLKCALRNDIVHVWGDGSIIRDYIYIDDVCAALGALIEYTGTDEVFNIGTGCGVTQNQIIDYVKKVNAQLQVEYVEPRTIDLHKCVLDNTRIQRLYARKMLSYHQGIDKYYLYLKRNLE